MRKLATLLLLPLLLLGLAACGDGNGNGDDTPTNTPEATSVATDISEPTDAATATQSYGTSGAGALFQTFNPLDLLGNVGQPSTSGQADPSLSALLLKAGDLPDGFTPNGEFTYTVPTEYGDTRMAANIFARGNFVSGNFDVMVMSAAVALPPEALEDLGDPSELSNLSEADLDQIRNAPDQLGDLYQDIRLLDAGGLGEGGAGMHMAMDFGALLGIFGAPEDNNPFAEGISMDMYMFIVGDHMLMTLVMWPGTSGPPVDGRALADAMDARA